MEKMCRIGLMRAPPSLKLCRYCVYRRKIHSHIPPMPPVSLVLASVAASQASGTHAYEISGYKYQVCGCASWYRIQRCKGAVFTVKEGHVDIRVSAGERAMIRSKAEAYGVTMSELVLAAVRAYERTYGEDVAEGEAVAVNYAAWPRGARAPVGRRCRRHILRSRLGRRRRQRPKTPG